MCIDHRCQSVLLLSCLSTATDKLYSTDSSTSPCSFFAPRHITSLQCALYSVDHAPARRSSRSSSFFPRSDFSRLTFSRNRLITRSLSTSTSHFISLDTSPRLRLFRLVRPIFDNRFEKRILIDDSASLIVPARSALLPCLRGAQCGLGVSVFTLRCRSA